MAAFHHQNSQRAAARKRVAGRRTRRRRGRGRRRRRRKNKNPELCRFVSEGEKPAARSNGPLIFPSCIKGSALWGGRAGGATLLIVAVCLAPRLRRRIHTYVSRHRHGLAQSRHIRSLSWRLSQELQRLVSLTRPSRPSETLKSDKRRSGTLPYSPPLPPPD